MIDTIVFTIINASDFDERRISNDFIEYPAFNDCLLKFIDNKIDRHFTQVSFMDYKDKKQADYYAYKIKSSSNYEARIIRKMWVNEYEVNLSIPKWLYGNNIKQFVVNEDDYDFYYNLYFAEYQIKCLLKRLKLFIEEFINNFYDYDLLKQFIIIKRVDMCFNVFYEKKEEAFAVLNIMKTKKLSYQREGLTSFNYKDSVFFKTNDYAFKIYHKGSEFKIYDGKKLDKEKAEKLQLIADKCLRIELSARNSYLSYIVNKVYLKEYLKTYNRVAAMVKRGVNYKKECKKKSIYEYEYYKNNILKSRKFYIYNNDKILNIMLYELYLQMVRKAKEFDIRYFDIELKEVNYGSSSYNVFLQNVRLYTLTGLKEMGLYSRSTFYRFRKKLMNDSKNVLCSSYESIDFNFMKYFQLIKEI